VSHSVNVTVLLVGKAYGEYVLALFLYACFYNGCWKRKRPSVSVHYEGACILFKLSIVFCLSQIKQTMNKYRKAAIPENGHHQKVCCSIKGGRLDA
jgi:NADH:ubiquinone oxidoreductase subunit H